MSSNWDKVFGTKTVSLIKSQLYMRDGRLPDKLAMAVARHQLLWHVQERKCRRAGNGTPDQNVGGCQVVQDPWRFVRVGRANRNIQNPTCMSPLGREFYGFGA